MNAQLTLYKPKEETSALALAIGGHYGGEQLSTEYYADDEMEQEFHGLQAPVDRLRVNASGTGSFVWAGGEESETKITGVILARAESRMHSPLEGDRAAEALQAGYSQELLDDKVWLCYNPEPNRDPAAAFLNPRLKPELHGDALVARIGGATGHGCMGCPAAAWRGDKGAPLCRVLEQWLFLPDVPGSTPVLLTISAASSAAVARKFLGKEFTQGRHHLNLFGKVVHLKFEKGQSGGRDVAILKPSVVGLVDPKHFPQLRATRNSYLSMMPRNKGLAQAAAEADIQQAETGAPVAPPVDTDAPEQAPSFGRADEELDDVPF